MSANNIQPWYPVNTRQQAILDFILWFSRFEYALKNTAYFRTSKGHLEPDWSKLKKYVKKHAIPLSLREVLILFRDDPPNKQVDHHLWTPLAGDLDWPMLIEGLKLVRNNLFHGGKHIPGRLLAPERDTLLISYCQTIMKELIQIVPEEVEICFRTA
jgi:hypothetical protein